MSRWLKKHRLHFDLGEEDHRMLRAIAEAEGEPMSILLRRFIRNEYRFLVKEGVIDSPEGDDER